MQSYIEIEGAREHNLKNIDLRLPHYRLIVFTGISGSGKSSLAYDTLYKEGQRRFIESLSPYARQFLGQMEKPKVDHIEGLSPAICIDQKRRGFSSRSTVGTVTEIYDHLRLLFARLGEPHCPYCQIKVVSQTSDQITRFVLERYQDSQLCVLAPMVVERKGEYRKELAEWQADGFVRVRVDGEIHRLDEKILLGRYEKHTIELVLDRLTITANVRSRLAESVEHAVRLTGGSVALWVDEQHYQVFSTQRACPQCGFSIPELEPRLFSFNNDQGACPSCLGRGNHESFDIELVVPQPELSIEHGALACMKKDGKIIFSSYGLEELATLATAWKVSLTTPWQKLPADFREAVLYGIPAKPAPNKKRGKKPPQFPGVIPVMQRVYDKWNLHQFRRFMRISPCPQCQGARLRQESLHVKFRDKNIADLTAMTVGDLLQFLAQTRLTDYERTVGREIFKELDYRLGFLANVGLAYLTLDRRARTLAGGEMQRIRLARQLGAGLQGVLYILDEPSIGLHPRDNKRLIEALFHLRDSGNTVVVIEHDEETMRMADRIIDIGPGAGKDGGEIIAEGTMPKLMRSAASLTGRYLARREIIPLPEQRRQPEQNWLTIVGAREHNLKNIDVAIPVGLFTVVTGVSGSGKSTLVDHILHKALANHFHGKNVIAGCHKIITGLEFFDKVIEVDQSPIGRTPRSNPATYIKVLDDIRQLFTLLPEAKARGYLPGRFSFNVDGGRCQHCRGAGYKEIEMQFLANVLIECEECQGQRFNRETLDITYKGKNIAEVLDMAVSEACEFFVNQPKIAQTLQTMADVGMGYIKLGQPSPTLSGGEAQRIKLVRELRRSETGRTLYILDEPTTGLHFADIKKLLYALNSLVNRGNTVLIIEHNLDVIKVADWLIDLGPDGGEQGGEVVIAGSPEAVMECQQSYTGKALKDYLADRHHHGKKPRTRGKKGSDIVLSGACKHNLKNITVRIPKDKMTVVTGVSGSGKSSLVFDTLFAEGQRAFLESLSTYARRFLGRLDHGQVDTIEGLAPAIAIDQKSVIKNPRSTVATMTEIYDYLRILYARAGTVHCPHCRKELKAYSPTSAAQELIEHHSGETGMIMAPLYIPGSSKTFALASAGKLAEYAPYLQSNGFTRVLFGGELHRLDQLPDNIGKRVPIHLVIDRIEISVANQTRLAEDFTTAFELGHKVALFYRQDALPFPFCTVPACVPCDYYQWQELQPRMFSFNHYLGACPQCDGLGFIGSPDQPCPECKGDRLQLQYLAVTVGGLSITQFCRQKSAIAYRFLQDLSLDKNQAQIARDLLREINNRLNFLIDVGLDYLTLDRNGNSLSGGEAQRIRLATQIGNRLVGVLYVLDEPTIGLHQRDTERLLGTLRDLVQLGNTVVMVEHDAHCIHAADHVIELGPAAGAGGGEIVAAGSIADIIECPISPTGRYLRGELEDAGDHFLPPANKYLTIHNASLHNLKNIDASFPIAYFSVVTGVSGSGKSTLLLDILQVALKKRPRGQTKFIRGNACAGFKKITGFDAINQLLVIDQTPLARSPHSNAATYCNIFTAIRELFASLPGAKMRGFKLGRFSFNRPGGRCEICEGKGAVRIEMHFLSDVWVTCDACQGRRFLDETLAVHYRGKNIAQVLELDVNTALDFFAAQPRIISRLRLLEDIGLGYLKLGQPTNTLSGGEAQRLKLAAEMIGKNTSHNLYIMDEPTTGLHAADIKNLLLVIRRLVDAGHTVIVIEHNLDVIKSADWVIDLGPEGGDAGGEIVCAGPLASLLACPQSHTGRILKQSLAAGKDRKSG